MIPAAALLAGVYVLYATNGSGRSEEEALEEQYDTSRRIALAHIRHLPKGSNIVFDFDDTLFRTRVVRVDYVGTRQFWGDERGAVPVYQPIRQMTDVLRVAAAAGMFITLVTARPDCERTRRVVLHNMSVQKLTLHDYHARPDGVGADFKVSLRANLAMHRPTGLSIGDKWTDVRGERHYIKLPCSRHRGIHTTLPRA